MLPQGEAQLGNTVPRPFKYTVPRAFSPIWTYKSKNTDQNRCLARSKGHGEKTVFLKKCEKVEKKFYFFKTNFG